MTSVPASWWNKFANALAGLFWSFRTQSSFWVHLPAALIVIALAVWLQVQPWRWCVLVVVIGVVLAAEMLNTAIEQLTKVVHPNHDPGIGRALDAAAGAVLIASIAAAVVGFITLGIPLLEKIFPS